ncbi:ATP-binding protein, partial [Acinetobacter baumannii]|nr:ATP-binding protein [Acinetobacter baumannii]
MELYKAIQKKNLRENLIEKNDKIVVGFSGGPDSVFLTEMLLKLKEEIEFEIILVHINHLLRGEASDGDERFSLEYGKKKGLKVFSRKI